jgi:hypothetical protein
MRQFTFSQRLRYTFDKSWLKNDRADHWLFLRHW